MQKPSKRKKKLDYPQQAKGVPFAAEAPRLASSMTADERAEHFRQAMVRIYGGRLKKAIGPGQ